MKRFLIAGSWLPIIGALLMLPLLIGLLLNTSVVGAHEPDNVHAHAVAQTSPIETPPRPTATPTPTPAPVPIPEPFPDGLPDTAAEAIEQLRLYIIALQGLITTTLITWLRKLPGLNEQGRSKIAGGLAAAISGIVSLAIALLVTYGATLAGFLDTNGFWNLLKLLLSLDGAPILVGAWPATYLAWLLKKRGHQTAKYGQT